MALQTAAAITSLVALDEYAEANEMTNEEYRTQEMAIRETWVKTGAVAVTGVQTGGGTAPGTIS